MVWLQEKGDWIITFGLHYEMRVVVTPALLTLIGFRMNQILINLV
jgi:hypothetical protein